MNYKGYVQDIYITLKPDIKRYKTLSALNNEARDLIELGFSFLAYDVAARKKIMDGDTIDSYLEQEIEEKKQEVKDTYFSSFLNDEVNGRIVNLIVKRELMNSEIDKKMLSPLEEIEQHVESDYIPFRRDEALEVQKRLELTDEEIQNLQETAFHTILCLLKNNNKSIIREVVEFLEISIDVYFPLFHRDLGQVGERSLLSLRRNTGAEYKHNTLCRRCGRGLLKKRKYKGSNNYFCIKKDNRSCYEARLRERKRRAFPGVMLLTKNLCENCGRKSPLDHIYKHKGAEHQFCSKRCWETYRKRK